MVANNIDILIKTLYQRTGIKAAKGDLDSLKYSVNKNGQVVDSFNKKFANTTDVMKDMGYQAKRFRMEWLSILFGGMAIQRVFSQIGIAAKREFKAATESTTYWSSALGQTELAITAINIALGEAINQALTPFSEWLMGSLENIINFIAENDKLIGKIIVFGEILGGLLAATGSFYLFMLGLERVPLMMKAIPASIGITFLITGIQEISEGNLFAGLSGIFAGMGLFLTIMKGAGGLGGGLLAAGVILGIIDVIKDGKVDFIKSLNLAFLGGIAGFYLGGPWGAGIGFVVTMALTNLIVSDYFKRAWRNFKETLIQKESDTTIDYSNGTPTLRAKRQFGGVIPATGLYKMHAGEMVYNPSFSSSVNVNATMSSSMDVARVANQVSSVIMRDIKRSINPISKYG